MADDKRITELPDASLPIASGVKFEAVQGGVNVKVDADDMPGSGGGGGAWGSITGTLSAQTDLQTALNGKIPVKVRNDVTLANGVVTINWAAGDIQNLTITEAKVITTISNPVVGETIILIIPGTNSLTFSGLTAVIEGVYQSGVENRIYIQCLKVSGGEEYRITYDSNTSPFPFSTLTDDVTVTWTISALEAISNRILIISGNRTFAISGAINGFSGNCKITASGGDRQISIPAGATHRMKGVGDTAVKTVTIPSAETYIFSWLFDGTNYDWWYID